MFMRSTKPINPFAASPAPAAQDAGAREEAGWLDSSIDLQRGLEVEELAPAAWLDTMPMAFPLAGIIAA